MAITKKEVSSVTLLILGEELDPDTITQLLGIEPSQSWKRGENKKNAPKTTHNRGG